jgi:eukaryotic-like serine/threonine-protein kinase
VKVLPENVANDPDRRARFDREAKAVAALSHANILAIFDFALADGLAYAVTELLEGETLRARLSQGALPIRRAVDVAIQIARGLAAAHEKGLTHRDLKPENVFLLNDGQVKILDFGLAKAAADSVADRETVAGTAPGTILGTVGYMAPEQVRGQAVDGRTDLFALGAVLYEMVAGRQAFQRETAAETMAAILKEDPPELMQSRADLPPALDAIVRHCLERHPGERFQSARDLIFNLQSLSHSSSAPAALGMPRPFKVLSNRAAWAVAIVSSAIALLLALRPPAASPAAEVVRLSLNPPENTSFTSPSTVTIGVPQFALSPDGRSIVFIASAAGAKPALWLRSLQAGTARVMPGTDGAEYPFWSPDGRWVGFFADGRLKKIPAGGGPALAITDAPDPRGGSWGPDETILFGTGTQGIYRASASSGTVARVTELDVSKREGSHRTPEFLPDGKHFLFTIRSGQTEQTGVYAGSLDGQTRKLVIRGNTNARYSSSGHLLFMDGDTLMGQAFDAEHLELKGQPFIVEDHVGLSSIPSGAVSVSGAGTLAHAGTLSEIGQLTWFDRDGVPSSTVGPPGDYLSFRLSPDQTRLAASIVEVKRGAPDIWLTNLAVGNRAPFTLGGYFNDEPVWSPDGTRIIFRTFRSAGPTEFYSKSAGGGGNEEPVLLERPRLASGNPSPGGVIPWDWSPDGRHLLYSVIGPDSGLWLLSLEGDQKPVKLLSARGDQLHGAFSSPDGKLVAYSSSESDRFDVHVQTVPLSNLHSVVSTAGGSMPRWRADGRELYYLSLDSKLMVVPVGPGPSFGAPQQLFQTRVPRNANVFRTHYVPSRDGQRFLINTLVADLPPVSITVVLNWTAGLKK